MGRLRALVFASSLTVAALTVTGVGCDDPDATTGKRVTLSFAVLPAKQTFTTKLGWEVTLTKAVVSIGALYFFDGETLFAGAAPRPRRAPLDRFWQVPVAHAHPGHYVPGNAKGELLGATSVDLLRESRLGDGQGVSGPFRSATFSFGAPATGPLAGELGGNVIVLEGAAKKGAEERTFRAEVRADELFDTKQRPQVEGCPFAEANVLGDGKVTVTIDASAWLDQVEFELLSKSGRAQLADVTQAELTRSVRGGDRYRFAFTAK